MSAAARDLARFDRSCTGANASAAVSAVVSAASNASEQRLLLVDARCMCRGVNGVGNLFGEYAAWFMVAALTERSLFIDWSDSARSSDAPLRCDQMSINNECLQMVDKWSRLPTGQKLADYSRRIRGRFDLGDFFERGSLEHPMRTTPWQWNAATRARVLAHHGDAAEHVLLATPPSAGWIPREGNATAPPGMLACDAITDALLSPRPWVTLSSTHAAASQGLVFRCADPHLAAFRGFFAMVGRAPRGEEMIYPNTRTSALLIEAHAAKLRHRTAPGAAEAAAQLEAATGRGGLLRADVGSFFHAPFRLTSGLDTWTRRKLAWPPHTADGAVLDRLLRPESQPRPVRLPVGEMVACVVHLSMRPSPRTAAAMAPLLEAVGETSSLVALQVRTGWADDAVTTVGDPAAPRRPPTSPAEFAARMARPLPRTHEEIFQRELAARVDLSRAAPSALAISAAAALPAAAVNLTRLLTEAGAALPASRWAVIAQSGCQRDPKTVWTCPTCGAAGRAPISPVRLPSCLSPSPTWIDAAALEVREAAGKRRELMNPIAHASSTAAEKRKRLVNRLTEWSAALGAPFELSVERAPLSRLGAAVECAAHLAQSVAAERRVPSTARPSPEPSANSSSSSAPFSTPPWKLYISSDSPGLRSLLERLPGLVGHVTGCPSAGCSGASHASFGHSAADPTSTSDEHRWQRGLSLATDLWMLGAADHAFAASRSSLIHWAARAFDAEGGRAQLLNNGLSGAAGPVPQVGDKRLPVCGPSCMDYTPAFDEEYARLARGPAAGQPRYKGGGQATVEAGARCFALRVALFSGLAAHALEQSPSTSPPLAQSSPLPPPDPPLSLHHPSWLGTEYALLRRPTLEGRAVGLATASAAGPSRLAARTLGTLTPLLALLLVALAMVPRCRGLLRAAAVADTSGR